MTHHNYFTISIWTSHTSTWMFVTRWYGISITFCPFWLEAIKFAFLSVLTMCSSVNKYWGLNCAELQDMRMWHTANCGLQFTKIRSWRKRLIRRQHWASDYLLSFSRIGQYIQSWNSLSTLSMKTRSAMKKAFIDIYMGFATIQPTASGHERPSVGDLFTNSDTDSELD